MHGFGGGEKKGNFREKRHEGKEEDEGESSPEQKDKYRGRKQEKKGKALTENDFPELA